MFQVSEEEQLFCEFSATKLRELQSMYHNSTSACTGNTDPDTNALCFITPKLQKLLSILKEDRNSKCGENELQLATSLFKFFLHFDIIFIYVPFLFFNKLYEGIIILFTCACLYLHN